MLFDFEWINPNLFMGLYKRTCSFFENSVLSSCGVPADEREKALLAPFPEAVGPEVMAGSWRPPVTDASGKDRLIARRALAMLRTAGWSGSDGVLRSADGKPLAFEILAQDRATERLALNYADNAKRLGIAVGVRLVDDAQFQKRKQTFDFDVIPYTWQSSLSPGNEQNFRWSSAAADAQGSFNFAGVKNPAADAMIKALLVAESHEDFVAAVRALDRVLISGYYVLPLYNSPKLWIARWTRTKRPDKPALAVGAYGDLLASDPILAHTKSP
jgi:peptide/nickel transport system substrate-binding protein